MNRSPTTDTTIKPATTPVLSIADAELQRNKNLKHNVSHRFSIVIYINIDSPWLTFTETIFKEKSYTYFGGNNGGVNVHAWIIHMKKNDLKQDEVTTLNKGHHNNILLSFLKPENLFIKIKKNIS